MCTLIPVVRTPPTHANLLHNKHTMADCDIVKSSIHRLTSKADDVSIITVSNATVEAVGELQIGASTS
jgi:hypothetical protein